MLRLRLRSLLSLLLLLAWLGVAAPRVLARESYDSTIKEALAEYERGNWTEARALFKRAYTLQPNARALRGAAAAAYGAKSYVAAHQDFTAALASTERALTPAQRAEVLQFLERVNAFLVRVRITLDPARAMFEVDGGEPVLENGELLLDPGAHEIVARAEGREPLSTHLVVEGGERRELTITLPQPSAAVAAVPQPAEPTTARALHVSASPSVSAWPWVTAGGAVVLVGGAIAFHLAADSGASNVKRACPVATCADAELERRIDDEGIQTYQTLSTLAWVLAGASAALSVVLFVSDDAAGTSEASGTALSVAPGAVRLSGRF